MDRLFFTFQKEPTEQAYRDLINYAISKNRCKYGFLIVHNKIPLEKSGEDALKILNPYLNAISDVSEWPGTKLYDQTAKLYKYNFGPDFAEQLKMLANGLYEWEQPHLPEDLSLMIDENLPWLFTIAHEKDAVLCLTQKELDDLQKNQSLMSILVKDKKYKENN